MRVVFQTPDAATRNRLPSGEIVEGTAYFAAVLYDPSEQTNPPGPGGTRSGRAVAEWLASARGDGALQVVPDSTFLDAQPALIPAAVLNSLPRDGRLQLLWHWTRKGAEK